MRRRRLSSSVSRTPSPSPSGRAPPKCRTNLLYRMAIGEGITGMGAGFNVLRTPGGSIRPDTSGDRPVFGRTPGGSVRRLQAKSPPPFINPPEELAELVGMSDQEVEGLTGKEFRHIYRWLRDSKQTGDQSHYPEAGPLEVVPSEQREPAEPSPDLPAEEVQLAGPSSEAPAGSAEVGGTGACSVEAASPVSLHPQSTPQRAERPVAGPSGLQPPVNEYPTDSGSDLDSEYDDEVDFPDRFAPDAGGRELEPAEELDNADAAMLAEADRIMDNEQANLPGISNTFEWDEDFSRFHGTREPFTGGPAGPTRAFDTPYDAFTAIWDDRIMRLIAEETNRYAWQTIVSQVEEEKLTANSRLNEWYDTDTEELYALFAMYIVMGFTPRLRQDDYWRTSRFFNAPGIRSVMPFNRYILLNRFLHFVDNYDADSSTSARLAKLMPIIRHCNERFQQLYVLHEHIAIDESLTLWKGRLSWAQRIRTKAARIGIKSYELCESSTGYLWRFIIYTGKGTGQSSGLTGDLAGKTTALVVNLLEGLEHKGYCITMDNWFNSPALARYLKSRGIDCVGTLLLNRRHVPKDLRLKVRESPEGTIVARHSGDVAVLSWMDKKAVSTISTIHDNSTFIAHRRVKGQRHPVPYIKPVVTRDYNKYMGGVDLKDQKLAMYLVERKRGMKWYIKMFKRLLNISIHNAYVLHRSTLQSRGVPILTHRQFREDLATVLLNRHTEEEPRTRTVSSGKIRLRTDLVHIPVSYPHGNRKRCAVCVIKGQKEKKVSTGCRTCNKGLCFEPCWEEYHSKADLQ